MESASPMTLPSWARGMTMDDAELQSFMDGTHESTKLLIPLVTQASEAMPETLRTFYDARVPLGYNLMSAVVAATLAISSGELFKDWPGWTRCVLKLLTRFIRLAASFEELKIPLTKQLTEDFLRESTTTSQGVTLLQVMIRLLDEAWKNRHVFIPDHNVTWQSEHLPAASALIRADFLIFLGSIIRFDYRLRGVFNRDFTQVTFLCWFHERGEQAGYADQLLLSLNKLTIMSHAQEQNIDTLTDFFKYHVHAHYAPVEVCKRLRDTFLSAKELDENLGSLCVLVTYFIADRKENVSYILEANLVQAMCALVNLPLVETKGPPNSSSVHVGYFFALRGCLRGVFAVLIGALKGYPFSRGAEVLIKECNIPLLLSWTFRLAAFYEITPGPDMETHPYALFVNNMFAELASSPEMRGTDNPLRQLFAQALRPEWYPVLKLLRKNTTTLVRELYIHRAWENLGKVMGLDEDAKRKHFDQRAKKLCSLVVCRHYTTKPTGPLRTCAGCGEVRYHSKPCQVEDWKEGGHKARCKRVK